MSTLLKGITVGPYEILDRLERGGMADVYLARNREAGEDAPPVVLRVIEYGSADPEALEAERVGAALQERLAAVEPRVPHIHAFGELDDCCFFVDMEYVAGEDLAETLHRGPLPVDRALEVASALCDVLDVAHRFETEIDGKSFGGIVHGDIKPKNIRIEPDGGVRVLDFGIAKALSLTRKQTRNVFASVAYASPERLEAGVVDQQADLWAVAVILYEMLTGRRPFRAATTQHLEGLIRRGRDFEPLPERFDGALRRVVHRALAFDPAERYPDAAAFRADLDALREGVEPSAPPGTSTRRTGPSPEPVPPPRREAGDGATRRTASAVDEAGGATRRTSPAVAEPPSTPPVRAEEATPARPEGRKADREAKAREKAPSRMGAIRRRLRKTLKGAAILYLGACVLLAVLEVGIWNQASALRRSLEAQEIDADAAWARYRQLDDLSLLNLGIRPAKEPVREALLAPVEEIIAGYRNDDNVREGDWEEARRRLQRLRELTPGDRAVEARYHYVEGHLDRIDDRGQDAVMHFLRASELEPDWPDPQLGLVNTYLYQLHDYEPAKEALYRLRAMDYPIGKREVAQLADADYFRGLELVRGCESAEDVKACLDTVRDHLEAAIERYDEIAPWGRSVQNRRHAREQLDEVEYRIAELRREEWQERIERFLGWD